ncbi:MAG: hypothetical protein KAT29_08750, partial [Anaerolineales bacterium]|nr:hypothetical protein [Anaerolineales bacterium]
MLECPKCGEKEPSQVKICHSCGLSYTPQDLQEAQQIAFLIRETTGWEINQDLLDSYKARLDNLYARMGIKQPERTGPQPDSTSTVHPTAARETPKIVVNKKAQIHNGPGFDFPVIGSVSKGQSGKLIGVNDKGDWWVVRVPKSMASYGRGWIKASDTTAFNHENIPVIQPPPLPSKEAHPTHPAPPREKVPFDQWLLSERNIKIALYTGGLLLVIAGLIFIGVNWTRIPGPGKFAITLMVTGLMYLGGYLLFQREAYRIGGIALLGVASGFLIVDFAVLQIYVLGPSGMSDEVLWLIASPLCLLFYMLTAYWTRGDLFTYLSLAALVSIVTAALVLINAPLTAFALAYALLALFSLILSYVLRGTS